MKKTARYLFTSDGKNVILVDWDDYDQLNRQRWYVGSNGYATCRIMLHKLLTPDMQMVDHANWNKLDNRKINLRSCTASQNMANRRPRKSTSGYKGVYWCKTTNKWRTLIKVHGKSIHGGRHTSKIDAAKAYDVLARKHYGEFARLNFCSPNFMEVEV